MAKPLKVLEVNKFYPPHIGGIETLIAQRAEYFAENPDVEVRVLVCQEKGRGSVEHLNGVEVTRCGSLGTYFSCPLSVSFLRKFRKMSAWADVIEIHTPFPLGDLACLLSGFKGRVIIAWHSDVIKQKKLLMLYKPLLRRFLRRADRIVTATAGHIESSAFLPEFRDKCRIIPYPLEIERYTDAPLSPILTQQLHKADAVKVLFVGRMVYYKGVEVLLDAFAQVRGAELFLCGTGPLEDTLRQRAQCPEVHFMGRLSDGDLKSAFADCDIFVLPSVENSEAFGIVQQEAMVYGKPVINTSLPTGVPYVSVNGETGLTVPPRDVRALAQAIQKLIDDPALRAAYGRKAMQRVREEYDAAKCMRQILEVLKGEV
jgi:rhamnosyl/mannosyltransferase